MKWLLMKCMCVLPFAAFACMAGAQTEYPDARSIPTFKANVRVVSLFFDVKDQRGRFIPNLAKDDFQVYEDGAPQTIKFFSADTSTPIAIGILVDTSASQKQVLAMEREIAAVFLQNVLREQDLAFVMNFDVDATLMQDLTHSPDELRSALRDLRIKAPVCSGIPGFDGGLDSSRCSGGTVLYDAIFLAAEEKLKHEAGRKAMVVLTDGQDEGSKTKLRAAIDAAQQANCPVYVLLLADQEFYGQYGYDGETPMKRIADETGGRLINVSNSDEKLRRAFEEIASEMRSQYSIGYTPSNHLEDGSFRQVEIKTQESYIVDVKNGYYAPKPQD
jgi:VWFA-related protein